MKNERVTRQILDFLRKNPNSLIEQTEIVRLLSDTYSESDVIETINQLTDEFVVKKMVDYDKHEQDEVWLLTVISDEEKEKYQVLSDVEKAFLKLLMRQNSGGQPGQIRYDKACSLLKEQGFKEEDIRFLWIKDITDEISRTEDGVRVKWCYLIPEWEKSPEYKEADRKSREQALEKDALKTLVANVSDTQDEILSVLKKNSDWHTQEQITKKLPSWCSNYIEEAFNWISDRDELIETKRNPDGSRLFRLFQDFDL